METKTKLLSLQDSQISLDNSFDLTPSQIGEIYGVDMPFIESFNLSTGINPQYLSLFAVSFLNLDPGSGTSQESFNNVGFGTLASELVIQGGSLNTKSFKFYKRSAVGGKGSLWLGGVHQDRGGWWRTGNISAGRGLPPIGEALLALPVYNSKLSDNRTPGRLEKLQLDFNSAALLKGVAGMAANRLKSIHAAKENCPTYVSDAYYSKSEQNALRFCFAINYLDIVKANGKYASLYKSDDELMTSCKVLSFNVIRRRLRKHCYLYDFLDVNDFHSFLFFICGLYISLFYLIH